MFFSGPQTTYLVPASRPKKYPCWRSRCGTLVWETTRRLVLFPTSAPYPTVGAAFIRITQSCWSISWPRPPPSICPELDTTAQRPQRTSSNWSINKIHYMNKSKSAQFKTELYFGSKVECNLHTNLSESWDEPSRNHGDLFSWQAQSSSHDCTIATDTQRGRGGRSSEYSEGWRTWESQ